MSAFIVSPDHIDYLVQAAIAAGIGQPRIHWPADDPADRVPVTRDTATHIGRLLMAANVASVAYRYADIPRDELPGAAPDAYTFTPYRVGMVTDAQALKALDCFEYQACEHPEWQDSPAQRFCDILRGRIIRRLPGYDAALWEIDRDRLAIHLQDVQRDRARRAGDAVATRWTLYQLPDGAGVVVAFDGEGRAIGGQAGFSAADVADALARVRAGDDPRLSGWQHLAIGPDAAARVAATCPAVTNA